jgi:hypothetical protein
MASLVGTDGGVVWLMAVLLLLTFGLGLALLAAVRQQQVRPHPTRRPGA